MSNASAEERTVPVDEKLSWREQSLDREKLACSSTWFRGYRRIAPIAQKSRQPDKPPRKPSSDSGRRPLLAVAQKCEKRTHRRRTAPPFPQQAPHADLSLSYFDTRPQHGWSTRPMARNGHEGRRFR